MEGAAATPRFQAPEIKEIFDTNAESRKRLRISDSEVETGRNSNSQRSVRGNCGWEGMMNTMGVLVG